MSKKQSLACLCAVFTLLSCASCATGKSTILASPIEVEALEYQEQIKQEYLDFKQKVDAFSASFSENAYTSYKEKHNFTVSPISVYMALSLAAECTSGNTQTQLLSALGVSHIELKTNISKLYRSLEKEHKATNAFGTEKITGQLKLSNSIWLDSNVTAKEACLNSLSENYYCYSYATDFINDNTSANQAIRDFVKKQTKNKINRDFKLSDETLFALINTLYLKDLWNYNGSNLSMTDTVYDFLNADGSTSSKKLLTGYYNTGRIYEHESYSFYYTTTYHGYKIKFILPKEGYTVNDIFNAETLSVVNSVSDFDAEDEENLLRYHTRCLFPEYKASYYGDIQETLQSSFGITDLFDQELCNFSSLTDDKAYCNQVIHATTLEVDRKGIEGAAVTIIPGAGMAGPDEYKDVYKDFVIDKAFAFLLTNAYDVTLFSGVVSKL